MIGRYLILFGALSSFISLIFYTLKHNSNKQNDFLQVARISFHGSVVAIILSSFFLLYAILTHQFKYAYVWNYSSTDLPLHLLISTFYAGQEGSFHLWALYTAIIGLFLIEYSSKRNWEVEVMIVFNSILLFLLLMLVIKNPYEFIWERFPNELIHTGKVTVSNFIWLDETISKWAEIPLVGKGLNPLLQNYWMAIHPQILFIGFSSMSIPYIFSVAAMLKKEYHSWIKIAKPWMNVGALFLGIGIILGGYWAYETLGWGGYWGWDPVENSSLIPWLICIASIHTMISQEKKSSYIKTNFILSILCFILVLYSTFLTRSGVLGDNSVHSFVDPGNWAYWVLLFSILIFSIFGFGLFFMRIKDFPKVENQVKVLSREFALFLGAASLVLVSIIVIVGTSSPIITNIFFEKSSSVEIAYYVKTTLPFGVLIALLIGVGQLLWWNNFNFKNFLNSIICPISLSILFIIVSFIWGVKDFSMILFLFTSAFALFVNLVLAIKIIRGNIKYLGAYLAHIGIALMFIGFVFSSRYDDRQTVELEIGKKIPVIQNYNLTYVGYHSIEQDRFAFDIEVEKKNSIDKVSPVMYYSNFTEGLVRNPDILNQLLEDFYVAPLSLKTPNDKDEEEIVFAKDEEKIISNFKIKFLDYDFDRSQMFQEGVKEMKIAAIFEIEKDKTKDTLSLQMIIVNGEQNSQFVSFLDTNFRMKISKIMPSQNTDESKIAIIISDSNSEMKSQKETLIVEVSIKPFINLVWIGTGMLFFGFVFAIYRRLLETKK